MNGLNDDRISALSFHFCKDKVFIAKPKKMGMFSNNLRISGTKLTDKQSAFYSPFDAIFIWAEAKKQGKTTAVLFWLSELMRHQ